MMIALAILCTLALTACDTYPDPIPSAYQCHQGATVTGLRNAAVATTIDRACYEAARAMGADQAPMPTIAVRVYGAGEAPRFCTDVRSGTCWREIGEGYEVEVRRPRFGERVTVEERLHHEILHTVLAEAGERSTHGRMRELGLCAPRVCDSVTDWKPRALR